MHKLLERQLRTAFGDSPPPGLERFLALVDASYEAQDGDRALLERSLELTSQELLERNDALRAQHAEQQVLFDSVPAIIMFKDAQNRIVRLNRAAAHAMGGTVESLQGRATEDVFPPEVAAALHADDLEVMRANRPKLGIVESHPGPDGQEVWLRTDKVPYRNAAGHVVGVIVLCVDITDLRRAEQALQASERRFRLMVETATEGIWQADGGGRLTFCNGVMAQMLGIAPPEAVGKRLADFAFPDDQAAAQAHVEAMLAGRTTRADLRFRRRDGAELWAQVSASPLPGPDGGYLGMVADVTERRRAEAALRQAYERLQEVDRHRMDFLSSAAHELGTPLTPVKLQLRVVRDRFGGSLTEDQRRSLDILDRSVERLVALVRDLLDAARLQTQHLHLEMATIDLAEAARRSVESFTDVAASRSVALVLDGAPGVPVRADPFRLGQVLDNLVGNAVKFTPPGGGVRVRVGVEADRAVVQVEDNGIGVDPQDQARLFQPFTQVHGGREAYGGTGLGLYISKGIVELLGGDIRLRSAGKGKGASFAVAFPLVRAAPGGPRDPP